jgi:hypothetical protein
MGSYLSIHYADDVIHSEFGLRTFPLEGHQDGALPILEVILSPAAAPAYSSLAHNIGVQTKASNGHSSVVAFGKFLCAQTIILLGSRPGSSAWGPSVSSPSP